MRVTDFRRIPPSRGTGGVVEWHLLRFSPQQFLQPPLLVLQWSVAGVVGVVVDVADTVDVDDIDYDVDTVDVAVAVAAVAAVADEHLVSLCVQILVLKCSRGVK